MMNRYLRHIRQFHLPVGLVLMLLVIPDSAWALQPHGEPEGLYLHQMAHLLFSGSLIYLFLHTKKTKELQGKGWQYLQIFCILFAAWNLLALIGHEAAKFLEPEDFINQDSWFGIITGPVTSTKLLYFITKMDHLIYVPALFCLVIALRKFNQEAVKEEEQ